ncbi:MAG: hypothetical protein CBB70_11780 [Planctomycetaceae bacterium TMED10]|nr:MAG: hypothetical protein CBB70_11780 [Planctomycetaceae bacterium TMED10]
MRGDSVLLANFLNQFLLARNVSRSASIKIMRIETTVRARYNGSPRNKFLFRYLAMYFGVLFRWLRSFPRHGEESIT